MRWVDRGLEPAGVTEYARQYTQGWIDYFQNGVGERPTDFLWVLFRPTMGSRTNNICWYCERQCDADAESGGLASTVDHFRPRSRFPQLAYEWTNWVYSCHACNVENKGDLWPDSGYVDPCATDVAERPDRYFDYDAQTGEIIPKSGLTPDARQKALHTINDLGWNKLDVMFYRIDQTRTFTADLLALPTGDRQALIALFTEQPVEYAGAIGMVAEQLRQAGRI
ncbi:MAG: HNH endonuclease [Dehalococcoidia bacterium]|nr:HNH endonuclease [Dehalococcoidia bacterium]